MLDSISRDRRRRPVNIERMTMPSNLPKVVALYWHPILFLSGEDAQAKAAVGGLSDQLGFFGPDLGDLSIGSRLARFPGGLLPVLNLVKFGRRSLAVMHKPQCTRAEQACSARRERSILERIWSLTSLP